MPTTVLGQKIISSRVQLLPVQGADFNFIIHLETLLGRSQKLQVDDDVPARPSSWRDVRAPRGTRVTGVLCPPSSPKPGLPSRRDCRARKVQLGDALTTPARRQQRSPSRAASRFVSTRVRL